MSDLDRTYIRPLGPRTGSPISTSLKGSFQRSFGMAAGVPGGAQRPVPVPVKGGTHLGGVFDEAKTSDRAGADGVRKRSRCCSSRGSFVRAASGTSDFAVRAFAPGR